ncbi:LOW QUALITY PROTEIN: POU class 2 homeobox associating factor 3 [Vicugna pacos]|uniref:LOW QUALITY PROTEIN: POU class 2 homeobox associating factor 3 n=1 Tax=Vicugna pacos TaxID=30538 RepID=A0ABM5CMP3_VICPA
MSGNSAASPWGRVTRARGVCIQVHSHVFSCMEQRGTKSGHASLSRGSREGTGHAVAAPTWRLLPRAEAQRPSWPLRPSAYPSPPAPSRLATAVTLDFAARTLRAQRRRRRGELEAHGEPGKGAGRSGRAELSRGSPRAIRGRTRCPRGRGLREEVAERRWTAERGRGPGPAGQARDSLVTRRGAGGPPLSLQEPRRSRSPPLPLRLPRAHSRVEVRARVAPGSRGHPVARERPRGPTYSPRLRGCPRSRRAGRPPRRPLGRARPLPRAGQPGPASPGGGPFRGRPPRRERCPRPPCTPPWSSRCADSTRSLRAPPRKACAREGGGGERREEGRAGAGPKEGGGKDGERERRRKGARERRQKKETGGREISGLVPLLGSLVGPSPAQGQGWPNAICPVLAPGLDSAPRARRGLSLPQEPEKPKVYQGVRVKITVKELLQQRRAHQAASGGTLSGGNSVHLSDPVPPSPAGLYFEPEPVPSTPNYFQPQEFSSCVSCEENPNCLDQIFDSYLQSETHPDPSLNSMQSTPHYFPDSFQAAPFCFNQSLTPGSSSDSSTLSGSLDYSYSPAQLPSYAPENYNSPPSLDTRNCGYSSEDCSYPHLPSHTQCDPFSSATASVCCCASCEAEHLDPFRVSEYFSHPSTDYGNFAPSAAATSDFYQRGANWDICYS